MIFLFHILHLLIFLLAIVFCCNLFTGAIEYIGTKLKLGNNATGSILTVIGTSLPETIVPIVAIMSAVFFGCNLNSSEQIALGAIIGSPFMLSTFALFLLGIVLFYKKRDKLNLNYKDIIRDYKYFLIAYIIAILASFIKFEFIKWIIIAFLIAFYIVFVYRTILKSKEEFCENKPKIILKNAYLQAIISILGLVVFSHCFMHEIIWVSDVFKISPLILSLIVTPFATELPECVNSVLWVNNNKDDLAIANVLGAVIFQSMILTSIGMILTPWILDSKILLNSLFVILCSIIFVLNIIIYKKISRKMLIICGIFYFGYFVLVLGW